VTDQAVSTDGGAAPASNTWSPAGASGGGDLSQKLEQRPELAVGGAFAGGLLLALILKRFARE
jgi:hypothetical protein